MKNRINRYAAFCILGLAGSLLPAIVNGQDLDMDTIDIIGPYNPTIADAYKISDFPKVDDTPPVKAELKYGINSDKFSSDFEVVPVKPARIKGEPLQKLYRGYIKLGGGSPGIFAADGFYNSLRSKRKSWGVQVNHLSSAGKIPDVGYSGFGETGVNLYGKKFLKRHTLSGGLDYDRNNLHFYGFDTTDVTIATLDDSIIGKDATLQVFNVIGGHARLLSHYKDSMHINYDVKFNYYNLTDNYQTMENHFNLSGDLSRYVEKEFVQVHIKIDHNDDRYYKDADSTRIIANTILTLRPQITAVGSKYKLTVGINSVLDVIGDVNAFGRIYPSVYFSYTLIKDIMIPYAGIGGGLKRNSIRILSSENPYILTDLSDDQNKTSINNTINSIKFYGGVKGVFGSSTTLKSSFNVSATWDKLDNQYFYVNDTSDALGNRFTLVYDNVVRFNVHAEMSFHVREKIRLMLVGDLNQYKMDFQDKAWHQPGYRFSFLGSYNLQEKIIAKADIFAIGEQYAKTYDKDGLVLPVKLKGVVDANIELEYRYTKKLSAYLKLNNIAAQQYVRWNGYPNLRFSFLGGITYIF
ncbi:MAG: hypothetical protein JKY52_11875 [Flavobacteriales bacterium]|nr:hypothetical protein [Flavobacteriales bacterium]